MIKKVKPILQVILVLIVQISLINNSVFFGFHPNLVLVYILFTAQKEEKNTVLFVSLFLGLLTDAILSANFGIRTLTYFIISSIILYIRDFIFEENIKVAIFYTLVGVIMYPILLNIIYFFLSYGFSIRNIIEYIFSMETIILVFVFILFQKIDLRSNLKVNLDFLERIKNEKFRQIFKQ